MWFGNVTVDIDFEMVPISFTPRQRREEEMRIEAERSVEASLDREAASTLHMMIWQHLCDYAWSDDFNDVYREGERLGNKSFFIYRDRKSLFTAEHLELIDKAGGWWTYDSVGHSVFVPLSTWLPRFETWYEKLEQRLSLHGLSQKKRV